MSTMSVLATFADTTSGLRVEADLASGGQITYDSDAADDGGGLSPMASLLAALAACTAMDVVSILRKKRQVPATYRIAVTGERGDEHPRVFDAIVVEHQVTGEVDAEAVRRSVELSATRYCPVNAMLSAAVRIEHRYRLARDEQDDEPVSAVVAVTGPA